MTKPMIKPNDFTGRHDELLALKALWRKNQAALVVIRGRRRIGKSRLVEEFAKGHRCISLTGLPPSSHSTAQEQRNEFSRQLGSQIGLNGLQADDWGDLFSWLAQQITKQKTIILLDEISWMGSRDPNFLGKLKIVWDLFLSKHPHLILILCGSISTWIEKNILSSTGFFGRIALKISLQELSLSESARLLKRAGIIASDYEKFLTFAVTGGIPWYLKLFDPGLGVPQNIKKLCFEPEGILIDEFGYIFNDLFGKRSGIYLKIVEAISTTPLEYGELAKKLDYPSSGPLSEYLEDLILSGFIRRDFTWNLKSGAESKLSKYRLRDNYLRFYLKYLKPHKSRIKKGQYQDTSIAAFPGFESIMGLQFESTLLNNRKMIQKALEIKPQDILMEGSFFQRPTALQKGCQIDYLIQTNFGTLYICEMKFSRQPIGLAVIAQMKQKIASLHRGKGFACVPVLVYQGELSAELADSGYFAQMISAADFFNE
jgi:AAA+ ATPase superfamily predicted ATPase